MVFSLFIKFSDFIEILQVVFHKFSKKVLSLFRIFALPEKFSELCHPKVGKGIAGQNITTN